jgi:hypothetical protein
MLFDVSMVSPPCYYTPLLGISAEFKRFIIAIDEKKL